MSEMTADWIVLANEGEHRFEAYRAHPAAGREVGILVLHDMFGITPPFQVAENAQGDRISHP